MGAKRISGTKRNNIHDATVVGGIERTFVDIRELLFARAGLKPRMTELGEEDKMFNAIAETLIAIHRGKEVLYGNYLETHGKEPPQFFLTQHFCDVKRKYVRAENFIRRYVQDKDSIPLEELLDTYSDIAVYAIMGIQAIVKVMNDENKNNVVIRS